MVRTELTLYACFIPSSHRSIACFLATNSWCSRAISSPGKSAAGVAAAGGCDWTGRSGCCSCIAGWPPMRPGGGCEKSDWGTAAFTWNIHTRWLTRPRDRTVLRYLLSFCSIDDLSGFRRQCSLVLSGFHVYGSAYKTFSVSAPSVWNSLSFDCHSAWLSSSFQRSMLNTKLFHIA